MLMLDFNINTIVEVHVSMGPNHFWCLGFSLNNSFLAKGFGSF
jgi:hypothetical protein